MLSGSNQAFNLFSPKLHIIIIVVANVPRLRGSVDLAKIGKK
jgi:hypothetical protein